MTGDTATTDQPNPRTTGIRQGRQADSARRRQRVIAVLGRATEATPTARWNLSLDPPMN